VELRKFARKIFFRVYFPEMGFGFMITRIALFFCAGYQGRKKLTTMVIPSIFVPEDWSFTFYEGLNRDQDSIFKDKTVAELGCGNGWISIAISEKWMPSKVSSSFDAFYVVLLHIRR
jgi:hypothetical protein